MKARCDLCGTDRYVTYTVLLGNQDLYGSLFDGRILLCDECQKYWTDARRTKYFKKLDTIAKKAKKEHDKFVADLVNEMKNAEAK